MSITQFFGLDNEGGQLASGGHDPIVVLETEMIRQRDLADSPSTA